MRRTFAVLTMLAFLIGAAGLTARQSIAAPDKGQTAKATAQKMGKSRGGDANVKSGDQNNNRTAKVNAPSSKGGPKARGGKSTGLIHIDNHTQWKVAVYNNGEYIGVCGPYGDLSYYAEDGSHKIYCRAYFPDGDDLFWGPKLITLSPGGSFTYSLY